MSDRIQPFSPPVPAQGTPPVSQRKVPDFAAALLPAQRLVEMSLEQRPALLGAWMKQGDLGYIFAPRGVGKTWAAMIIGNAIAEGLPLGEWVGPEDGGREVIYLDCEMNLPDVQERSRMVGITSSRFRWLSNEWLYQQCGCGVNIADREHQVSLSAMLPDGSLFIIDNLSTGAAGMAENDNDAFDMVRDWLLSLRYRRITVLIVHHAGRNGAMRGASRREDSAHWIISLKDATEDGARDKAFTSSFTKCRNCAAREAPPLKWTLKDEGGKLTVTCAQHNGPDAMLGHIRDGVESATELAELLGVQAGTISKWSKKLIEQKLIEKVGRSYKALETSPF